VLQIRRVRAVPGGWTVPPGRLVVANIVLFALGGALAGVKATYKVSARAVPDHARAQARASP